MGIKAKKLKKLIDDYGHAMYDLGDWSSDYKRKQVGIMYARLHVYLEWGKLKNDDTKLDG